MPGLRGEVPLFTPCIAISDVHQLPHCCADFCKLAQALILVPCNLRYLWWQGQHLLNAHCVSLLNALAVWCSHESRPIDMVDTLQKEHCASSCALILAHLIQQAQQL